MAENFPQQMKNINIDSRSTRKNNQNKYRGRYIIVQLLKPKDNENLKRNCGEGKREKNQLYQRSSNEINTQLLTKDKGSPRRQDYTVSVLKENDHQLRILYPKKISSNLKIKQDTFRQTKTEMSLSLAFLKEIIKGILQTEGKCPWLEASRYQKK